jgi:hypothetical protein
VALKKTTTIKINYTVLIARNFIFVFPRLWEIQCRILNNAISIVRNSAYIFYSFRKCSLGFSIIKLSNPTVDFQKVTIQT